MLKIIVLLAFAGSLKIIASSSVILPDWQEAVRVVNLQQKLSPRTVEELRLENAQLRVAHGDPLFWSAAVRNSIESNEYHIKAYEALLNANHVFKGKKAPIELFTTQPKRGEYETEPNFKGRMLIPSLLCQLGWEGTLFLMASGVTLERFFENGKVVPLSLKNTAGKEFVQKRFGTLEKAAEEGKLSAVLCLLSPINRTLNWQQDFVNGFSKHCNKSGYSPFAHYVLNNSDTFFECTSGMSNQIKSWKAQCFAAAALSDLATKRYSSLLEDSKFKELTLTQNHIDSLYQELAKISSYRLMEKFLTHAKWPKPSKNAENFAFQCAMQKQDYKRAAWVISEKPGKKPSMAAKITETFLTKNVSEGKWYDAEAIITALYNTRLIPVSAELTDSLYVLAAAFEKMDYLNLLATGNEIWTVRPSAQAIDDAFVHACMNNKSEAFGFVLAANPTNVAFDRGLLETVKYRYQEMFDDILARFIDRLSVDGMTAALTQAGKPSQRQRSLFDCSSRFSDYSRGDNYYQQRLKTILGLPVDDGFSSLFGFEPLRLGNFKLLTEEGAA